MITDWFGDSRAVLFAAIEQVLPGRVFAFPPPAPSRVATPAVWIDRHSGFNDNPAYLCEWRVVAAADGADTAQLRLLDEICSAMLGACRTATPISLTGHESTTVAVADDVTLRGVEFTVTVMITAATFCPTIPESATIPTTLEVSNHG